MDNNIIDQRKAKKFIISLLAIFLGIFLVIKSIKYVAPFILALILAFLLEPVVRLLVKRLRFPRKLASVISVVAVLLLISLLITYLISKLVIEATELIESLPGLSNEWYNSIILMLNNNNFVIEVPEEMMSFLMDQLAVIVSSLANFANNLFKYLVNTAMSFPSMLVFIIITVLATYFFLGDKEKFIEKFKSQVPESLYNQISFIRTDVISHIFKLIRAYLIIMCITFTEIFIGLTILKVEYAALIAAIIAVFDILPVLGTGGILIPWAIISFITEDFFLGVGLIILYFVVLVVRQVIEPKIIGSQIGIHPLMTLASMYIGLKILGAAGLLLGPITLLFLKSIFNVVYQGQNLKELLFVDTE